MRRDDDGSDVFTTALNSMLAASYDDPFRRSYAASLRESVSAAELIQAALAGAQTLTTTFSASGLSQALAQVARIISVSDQLNAPKQTFFITFGGWDHHDDVIPQQEAMLPVVSRALAEFHSATTELGVVDRVTTSPSPTSAERSPRTAAVPTMAGVVTAW